MTSRGRVGEGVAMCEKAFIRLLEGGALVPSHFGIEPYKITAGVVSVEAGFDRGYLKKSRNSHKSLIARIDALREQTKPIERVKAGKLQILKVSAMENMLRIACEQRDAVLVQNLQLWERISDLELELSQKDSSNVTRLR